MKRIFSNVMLLAAAATAFFSCQKPEVIVPETSQEVTLTFASEKPAFDDETKTEWTGNTIQWSKGDKISVAYTVEGKWQSDTGDAEGNAKLYKSDELKESSEIAQFNVSTYFKGETEGTHVFYGVYPAPTETSFASASVADLEVPSRQTPKDSSFDPQADLMTGVSVGEFTSRPAKGETISMKWNRLVAHANITLRKLNGAVAGETVLNIKLTAQEDAKLVGNQQINILKNEVVNNDGLSNTIEIDGSNLAIDADGNLEFWACVLPETIKALTVIVDTDKATYTREITGISRTFIQNARNTLPINMSGAVREEKASNGLYYEKVTSQLEDWSGQYLVVFGNNAHATLDSKDFKATTVVAIDDDKIIASDDYAKAVMTVTKSGEKYNMTYPNGKYFSMAHNSSGASESPFDLEFTYTDDGVKIIGYVTAKEDYYILYNNGGNYYRCYVDKNGQAGYSLPILYRLSDDNTGGGETPEPEQKTLVSIAVSNEKTEYYVGEEFVKPTVTATYDDDSTADVTNSAEFSGYDMAAVGDQTVTVSYTEDSVTQTAEYCINVNEAPSGPIVATIAEFLEEEPSTAVWYQLTGTISNISNTTYGNFDLTDDTGTVYVYGLKASKDETNTSFSTLGLRAGDTVTLIGNREIYNGTKDEVINAYYVSHVAAPYIEVSTETIYVAADVTSVEFTVEANVGWGVSESDGVNTSIIDVSEDELVMTISAEFSANETAEAKTYVITFIPEGLDYVKTVTIIQAAPSQGGEELVKGITYTYEISNKTSVANSWNKLMGGTTNAGINISGFNNKSVLMDDLTWNISASGANSIYFSGQQIGSSSNYISSFELETNSYEGAVESITLSTCSNAGSTSIEVYVGGKQIGSTVTLPNSSTSTDVVFQGESLLEGNIYIKYTVPINNKNIKIAKITIN